MDRRQGYRPEGHRTEEQAEGGELDDAGKEHALGHGFHSVLMSDFCSCFVLCKVWGRGDTAVW